MQLKKGKMFFSLGQMKQQAQLYQVCLAWFMIL